MTVTAERMVRVTRKFEASPERVFDAWLNPETAGKWLFATPNGEMVRCEIDARVGGKFRLVDRRDGDDVDHLGEYVEIDRPRRLVFTFAVPKFSWQYTKVTVEITPTAGGCELRLTQEHVLPEWASRTEQGWGMILSGLAESLKGGTERYGEQIEPATIRFERLLPGPIERVWAYLTESDKRGKWLAMGEMEPRVGGSATLNFDNEGLSSKKAPVPDRYKNGCGPASTHRVTRYEPPHLLGLTWGGGGPEPSEVIFELKPQGDKVLLVLTHAKLPNRKFAVDVASGWHTHLSVLGERLNGREPDAFWATFTAVNDAYEKRLK